MRRFEEAERRWYVASLSSAPVRRVHAEMDSSATLGQSDRTGSAGIGKWAEGQRRR
jgi:hypothetical protein